MQSRGHPKLHGLVKSDCCEISSTLAQFNLRQLAFNHHPDPMRGAITSVWGRPMTEGCSCSLDIAAEGRGKVHGCWKAEDPRPTIQNSNAEEYLERRGSQEDSKCYVRLRDVLIVALMWWCDGTQRSICRRQPRLRPTRRS